MVTEEKLQTADLIQLNIFNFHHFFPFNIFRYFQLYFNNYFNSFKLKHNTDHRTI